MTVTINLPRKLEGRLREQAAKLGVDAADYVIQRLESDLRREDTHGLVRLSSDQTKLLRDMNAGLSTEIWERYHSLVRKRRADNITSKEHRELIKLSDIIENANVRRLELAINYARTHEKSLEEVMRKFKVGRLANV